MTLGFARGICAIGPKSDGTLSAFTVFHVPEHRQWRPHMLRHRTKSIRLAWQIIALSAAGAAVAQAPPPPAPTSTPVIYPANGQSDAQQEKDKTECYSWATKQTGYDPVQALQQQQAQQAQAAQAAQAAAAPPPSGQVAGGAARGAAGGALIGAAAGDAGKGAAVGAAVGAVGGSARKRRQAEAQQQAQQNVAQQQAQQNAANSQKLADYQRNFGACMQGRGYGVK
jgi:Glycine zipper